MRWRGWKPSRKLIVSELPPTRKAELLHSLADHPGFQYLMARIEASKAIYEGGSRQAIAAGQRGLDGVIAAHTEAVRNEEAIFWIGFLQWMVRKYDAMPNLDEFVPPDSDAAA